MEHRARKQGTEGNPTEHELATNEQGTRKQRNREARQSTELSDFPDAPITLMTRPETIGWKIPVN